MDNYQKVMMSRKDIILNNFLGGIFWGLGGTIGLAVILALLGILLHFLNVVPFVGNFVTEISKYVNSHK